MNLIVARKHQFIPLSNFSSAFAGKRLISIPLIMQEIHPEPETLVC